MLRMIKSLFAEADSAKQKHDFLNDRYMEIRHALNTANLPSFVAISSQKANGSRIESAGTILVEGLWSRISYFGVEDDGCAIEELVAKIRESKEFVRMSSYMR